MKRLLLGAFLFLIIVAALLGQTAYLPARADSATPTSPPLANPSTLATITTQNAAQLKTLKKFGLGMVKQIVWSADGELLVVCTSAGIALFRTNDFDAPPRLLQDEAACVMVAISPDSQLVASYGNTDDATVRVWDATTGNLKVELRWQGEDISWVYSLAFSPDSTQLAFGGESGAQVWNFQTETQQLLSTLPYGSRTTGLAFSPDGSLLAAASIGYIRIWDVQTGASVSELKNAFSVDVRFSADGKFLVSTSGYSARLWHVTGGQRAVLFNNDDIFSAQFSADGSKVITGNAHAVIEWDSRKFVKLRTQKNPFAPVQSVALNADGTLAAATDERQINIFVWETQTGNLLANLSPFTRQMRVVRFDAASQQLVFGGVAGVWRWSISSDNLLRLSDDIRLSFEVAGFLEHGKQIFSSGEWTADYSIWDTATGQMQTPSQELPYGDVKAVNADGSLLAIARPNAAIELIDTQNWQVRHRLLGHTDMIRDLVFSADGKWLASCANDSTIRIWDTTSGNLILTITDPSHLFAADTLAFSPDASMLASTLGGNSQIDLWDTQTGKSLQLFAQPSKYPYRGGVSGLAFNADGTILASSGYDGDIHLWDVQAHRSIGTLTGHVDAIYSLGFSDDGNLLASAGEDGVVRVWGIAGD